MEEGGFVLGFRNEVWGGRKKKCRGKRPSRCKEHDDGG